MKKKILVLSLMLLLSSAIYEVNAFCGFYVAKTDAKLFNKASQVILVRNGNNTTITMSNDFQGDVKDFAMVVPVPTVLKRNDIRVVNQSIFDALDAYSGPRLVEYYDQNPCHQYYEMKSMAARPASISGGGVMADKDEVVKEDYKVTIEATYTVGEYDILILSAEESGGLERWLTDNGYKIPAQAREVLEPYIKSNMKFFVVKVNLEEQKNSGVNNLRPLQLSFESPKFMLPIRLGMANADGSFQDLIVYAFSQQGRVETTNYRTVKMRTDKNVPIFIKDKFSSFYKSLFDNSYEDEKNVSYLEYAWDISSNNYMHCDPCSSTPPAMKEMQEAGVKWLNNRHQNDYSTSSDYTGTVYFTRLHVRYDRANFAQDLMFQETSNHENFQCRYVLQHPVHESVDCDQAYTYYKGVYDRRKKELYELSALTGWKIDKYDYYTAEYKDLMNDHAPKNSKANNKGSVINMDWADESLLRKMISLVIILSMVFVAINIKGKMK